LEHPRILPAETRGYVPAFIAINYVMNYYKRHNIVPQGGALAIATDTMVVSKFVPLSRVSAALGMSLRDLTVLNPAYRQLIVNGSATTPRSIVVPKLDGQRQALLRAAINDLNAPIKAMQPIQYTTLAWPQVQPVTVPAVVAQLKPVPGQPGEVKAIPLYYTTQKGDTLGDIAAKYGIRINELLQLNKELGGSTTVRLMPGLTVKLGRG
jgi:membrane-bound lytic murein transglycosylase D